MHTSEQIKEQLKNRGLRVTLQRILVLEAIYGLNDHPTAESIAGYIRKSHLSIATGTVYKVLDILVKNQLIRQVKTEKGVMRYDGILEKHHHLYCSESDKIEDYNDKELDGMLESYFQKKKIPGFEVDDIKLEIKGKFKRT